MSNTREVIIPPGMEILYEKYHYCPGIKVGNTLYISGQVGRDENLKVVEDTEAQFVQAFENVKKVLLAAGGSFDDVVEMTTYHVTGANVVIKNGMCVCEMSAYACVQQAIYVRVRARLG